MKKLTRLKLINWHRFSDVTIDFGDSTLISHKKMELENPHF